MSILVTGGAGFIGCHLIKHLLELGHDVVCIDNFILGSKDNVEEFEGRKGFYMYDEDASDIQSLNEIMKRHHVDQVFHLAANSDIQKSSKYPGIDYTNTFATTYSILECMRTNGIKKLFFASTSAVYGEKMDIELSENIGNLAPISYYGGAKLASEAFISSYAYMNDFDVTVFRFPNVIGPNLTHGVIFDFIRKLQKDPSQLEILGNGTQSKPYLYVLDLIEAILLVSMSGEKGVNIYNIGVEGSTNVKEIADMVCSAMGLQNVKYNFTGGNCGWKGDVRSFKYDLTKINQRGWSAKHASNQSVLATLDSVKWSAIL